MAARAREEERDEISQELQLVYDDRFPSYHLLQESMRLAARFFEARKRELLTHTKAIIAKL